MGEIGEVSFDQVSEDPDRVGGREMELTRKFREDCGSDIGLGIDWV